MTKTFAYKNGRATAAVDLTVFHPDTGELITETSEPTELRLRKR